MPLCFINTIIDWYHKLFAVVRWNGVLSKNFSVILSGVRQGGVLSPILFNLYTDDLIHELESQRKGCTVNNVFIGCILYADDVLLLSPSVKGLQAMTDLC